jgi:hypothetical protein
MTARWLILPLLLLTGCIGPTGEPVPLPREHAVAGGRFVLDQTYIATMGGVVYTLPYGPYAAEAADERGTYYRAPIPIKTVSIFSGKSLAEGGIYVPDSSFQKFLGLWLYLYQEDGSVETMTLPGNLAWTEGTHWRLEPAEPSSDAAPAPP